LLAGTFLSLGSIVRVSSSFQYGAVHDTFILYAHRSAEVFSGWLT